MNGASDGLPCDFLHRSLKKIALGFCSQISKLARELPRHRVLPASGTKPSSSQGSAIE
jgi:hypothetical protein